MILGLFWESLGSHFGHLFLIFQWFGVPKWKTVSRSMFLVIRGWKWCQIAEAACAITMVKLMFLNGFTFSTFSLNWCPRDWFKVPFWCLLVTLGALFRICEGLGDRLEIGWFFRGTLGEPRLRSYTRGKGTGWSVGSSKQVTNHQLLTCKQLKADTRLVNC